MQIIAWIVLACMILVPLYVIGRLLAAVFRWSLRTTVKQREQRERRR